MIYCLFIITKELNNMSTRNIISSAPLYIFCMTCGSSKKSSVNEQCSECYDSKLQLREYHPINGFKLEDPYVYSVQTKIPFTEKKNKSVMTMTTAIEHEVVVEKTRTITSAGTSALKRVIDKSTIKTFQVTPEHVIGDKPSVTKEILNIVFLLDITGSMGSYIEMAKNKIKEMMGTIETNLKIKLTEAYGSSDGFSLRTRISIIGYRDFNDKPHFEYLPFTTHVNDAHGMLSEIRVNGGSDVPEDILGAFTIFFDNFPVPDKKSEDFAHTTSALILVADAPGHGHFMNGGNVDNHATDVHDESRWKEYLQKLKEYRFDFLCVQLTNSMNQMTSFLENNYNDSDYKVEVVKITSGNTEAVSSEMTTKTSFLCRESVTRRTKY